MAETTAKRNYRWRDEKFYARVANSIANRVNSYQEKYNALQSDYQKRNAGRKYTYEDTYVSDSADWADSVSLRRQELDAEADEILRYMDRFKDGLDGDAYAQTVNGLQGMKKKQGMIADAATKDHEWWSNFENEEAYQQAGVSWNELQDMLAVDIPSAKQERDTQEQTVWQRRDELAERRGQLYTQWQNSWDKAERDALWQQIEVIDKQQADLILEEQSLSEKKDYLWQAENVQKYHNLQDNEDWAEQSSKSAPLGIYQHTNSALKNMNADEIAEFNYVYNTQGAGAAKDYLDYLSYTLNARSMEGYAKWAQSFAQENPNLANLYSVGANLISGIGYLDALGQDLAGRINENVTGEYSGPIDYNRGAMAPSVQASTIRGIRAQDIAEDYENSRLLGFLNEDTRKAMGQGAADLYQLGMSAVDSAATAALSAVGVPPAVGTLLLSGSAATQGTLDAIAKGASDEEALAMGFMNGAFEYLFERYEIEGLLDAISEGTIGRMLTQALTEGFGEGATSVANMLADITVMAEKSDWQQSIDSYMQKDPEMSKEEAQWLAFRDAAGQVGKDIIGGMLMGGGMTAGGIGIRKAVSGGAKSYVKHVIEKAQKAKATREQTRAAESAEGIPNFGQAGHTEAETQDLPFEFGDNPANRESVAEAQQQSQEKENLAVTEMLSQREATPAAMLATDSNLSAEDVLTAQDGEENRYRALENRVDRLYSVSDSGKTELADTGEEVAIDRIESLQGGKMRVRLEDGRVVDASEIAYASDSEAYLYAAVRNIEHITAGDATAIVRDYDPSSGQKVGEYLNGVDEAYTYGYYGYKEADLQAGDFTGALTGVQKKSAYVLGQLTRNSSENAKAEKHKKMRTAAEVKKKVDNSTAGNDNSHTEKKKRGEDNDNRRVRENAADESEKHNRVSAEPGRLGNGDPGVSEEGLPNGRRYSEKSGATPKGHRDPAVGKRQVRLVTKHIQKAKNSGEIYDYLVALTGKSEKEMTAEAYDKAVAELTERLYADAVNKHPVEFENNWSFMGELTKLRNALLEAAQEEATVAESDKTNTAKQANANKGKQAVQKKEGPTVTYNEGNGKVVSFDDAGIQLTPKQEGGVAVVKILHKLGLGTRFEFFSSYESESLTDENGDPLRVYLDDEGAERSAYSGVYRMGDGTIRIDLEAYDGSGLTLNAVAHELTHFIQEWSDEKYRVLGDFLIKAYEKSGMTMHKRVLREQKRLESHRREKVSYAEAYDEVVANAMMKMLDDGSLVERLTELKAKDHDLAKRLWEGFKRILGKFTSVYEKESALFYDTADLMAMKDAFEQLQGMFAEALMEASENYRAAQMVGAEKNKETESVSPFANSEQYSPHAIDRQQYNAFREKFAKERLDSLSDKLGNLFPLSAEFEHAIQKDKTPVSNLTIVANSQKRANGESFYTAAKNAFKSVYGSKTTFSIKQLGINAAADDSFARESISKASDRKDKQTILDLTPAFKQLIEESRLLAVERLVHNDNKEKSLLCYRLYNAYMREETYIDDNGIKQTHKVPHIVVFSVIQNLADAKAHMVTDIKDVAISNGHNSSKLNAAHANGNIFVNSIADIYDIVKNFDRKKGGLRYSSGEINYQFDYTQKDDGELYSGHATDSISNRALLANALESITQNSAEYEQIQEYKEHIANLDRLQRTLRELNASIRKIRFGSGPLDTERLKSLESMAKEITEEIDKHDRILVSLEATEALRGVIQRERKKAAQKTREHVAAIQQGRKESAERTQIRHQIRRTVNDLDKLLKKGNKKQNVKEDMKGFVSKALELADYLMTDHITDEDLIRKGITVDLRGKEPALVQQTKEILSKLYDHADSLTDQEFTQLDARRKENLYKLREVLKAQRNEYMRFSAYDLFEGLATEYAKLADAGQNAVKGAYDPEIEKYLRSYLGNKGDGTTDRGRETLLQNMRVADMTTEELWKLHNAYKMVLHAVRTANQLFIKGKNEAIDRTAQKICEEVEQRKTPDKKTALALQKLANQIGWDYEKLYYALDRIGSEALTELVMNVANSENTVMQDVIEAVEFRDATVKKFGYNDWAVNKELDREFLDNTGKKFKLTPAQIMTLYAYSKREGAWKHLEVGGFVFGKAALTNPKPADSYKLTKEQVEAITGLLTAEQKRYADAMQKFLSDVMGAKGNEVSLMLYGIEMFGEKNYFPIHVAGQYMAQAQEAQAKAAEGFKSMVNAGFTHERNPDATTPIIMEGFMDIWCDHVNEMSRYHGTVPALEDMRKVLNFSAKADAAVDSSSVQAALENTFGKEAVNYLTALYREVNSGAVQDKLEKKGMKWVSLFRKNSVAYSLSVLIQQPSAIVRAYAMIDRKFFGVKGVLPITLGVAKFVGNKWTKAHTNAYNEMLRYAPGVTMAKEIGGFDTHTGASIRSYLMDTGKSLGQSMKTETLAGKGKALLNKVDDNAIANLPNLADKIAWIEIWNACKREVMTKRGHEYSGNQDAFLAAVGERFTEVVRATQVYDSIFAKSPWLKSKSAFVQMMVSFMNEPNVNANMAEKAVRDLLKGDWKQSTRTAHVLIHSVIANNLCKSLIYAMRDDDEDETYIEKYLEALVTGFLQDVHPLNYFPVARDFASVLRGYANERDDMSVLADSINALYRVIENAFENTEDMTEEELAEFDKKVTKANWNLAQSLAACFGIPLKNIRREYVAILNTANTLAYSGDTTKLSLGNEVREEFIKMSPLAKLTQSQLTREDKLYGALMAGDEVYLDRLKGTYKSEAAYESAAIKALRDNDERVHEAALAGLAGDSAERSRIFREIKAEGKVSAALIIDAINSETNAIRNADEPDKVVGQYEAYDFVAAVAEGNGDTAKAVREDILSTYIANGKTQTEAEAAFRTDVKSGIREAYSYGDLSTDAAKNMLTDYAELEEEDAATKVAYWDFSNANPNCSLSEAKAMKYLELAEPVGISLEIYEQFVVETKDLADKKDAWGDVEVSKRDQVLEVIDSLPLTWEQKDALYLAAGYAENKLWDVPW